MPSPSLELDTWKSGRISDLLRLRDQLLDKDLKARFACSFYYTTQREHCDWDCRRYVFDHPEIFENAVSALKREVYEVESEYFISVLRTIFCSQHDPKNSKEYERHFEKLWDGATREVQSEVWDAFRESCRGIYQPSSPRRPVQIEKTHSAPTVELSSALGASPSSTSSSLGLDLTILDRLLNVKPILGDSPGPSVDDTPVTTPTSGPEYIIPEGGNIYDSPSSASASHKPHILKVRSAKSGSEPPLKTSAQVSNPPPLFTHIDFTFTKEMPRLRVELGHSKRNDTNVFSERLPESQTVFGKLRESAKAPTHEKE
jgi:hypothetical protein